MFLPISKQDMLDRGIDALDFVYIIGDAYVDHSSFGHAIISRVLEHAGYTVGIISQPDWHTCDAFRTLGTPRLGFLVSSGNIDPMVNHYTASKKLRTSDMYSPGGVFGKRPDRATVVYCNRIREAFGKKIPIIIGGIEPSLRRFAHYDYWSDKVRRSILIDSGADLLIYGMGEHQIVEIADLLRCGVPACDIKHVAGTCYIESADGELPDGCITVPSFAEVSENKQSYAKAAKIQYEEQDAVRGKPIAQLDNPKKYVVQLPPSLPLTTEELDDVYELPYEGTYHPSYERLGGVPAINEIKFSITSCRGCFGGCSFCALTFHQGRTVTARSHESILREAKRMTEMPDFKGYIHDVGGPTANFRHLACDKQAVFGACKGRTCAAPEPCENLNTNHDDYIALLRKLRKLKGVKKVFVRSGLRYDYVLADNNKAFVKELCEHHVSGQLKVAPEHCSATVLDKMGKPHIEAYIEFSKRYFEYTGEVNKEQYLVPYLMSSHPGSTLDDAVELALFLKKNHIKPEQVQDFYPTPGTISTTMYYTGLDPYTMKDVYCAKNPHDKALQRALLQYFNPKNAALVEEALKRCHRYDLIGNGEGCLIRPGAHGTQRQNGNGRNQGQRGKNSGKNNNYGKNKNSRYGKKVKKR